MAPVRFGILGAGSIATRVMRDLPTAVQVEVTCVAARELARAQAFAARFGIATALGSYEELVARVDVDVVYIATPHPLHKQQALLAMRAGKHVLCEKPAALNSAELAEMLACAAQNRVFFMEAMWTRLMPAMLCVKELLAEGVIGPLATLHAGFSGRAVFAAASRLYDLALGGGALLDIGCYPIHLAIDLLGGAPEFVTGAAVLGSTGVDEQNAMLLRFPGGGLASLSSGLRVDQTTTAVLCGPEGSLEIPEFYHATQVLLRRGNDVSVIFEDTGSQRGFAHEFSHVAACVSEGRLESPRVPHRDSIAALAVMDSLRKQWGLRYPTES